MSAISKHQVLMQKAEEQIFEDQVFFYSADGEDLIFETFLMNGGLWFDMGQPETITVTVVPGDTLNDDG